MDVSRFTRDTDEPEVMTCEKCGEEKVMDEFPQDYASEPNKGWCWDCLKKEKK
jgi:hypothetical protein